MDYFITQIDIKKVRHLENITIQLSETERKHLILTGKNGSGKTSVLEYMKENFKILEDNNAEELYKYLLYLPEIKKSSDAITKETQLVRINEILDTYKFNNINIRGQSGTFFFRLYKDIEKSLKVGDFILVYFPAKRLNKPQKPEGATKLELPNVVRIEQTINEVFIQRLVNLQTKSLYAKSKNDIATTTEIDNWFANFEKMLQTIFQDDTLYLEFDVDAMNYYIITKGREKFDFTTLSDGYSALLNIVTELMLRMESKAPKVYDMQGIVLIDEIETHLHIDLQEKILPMLTTFFPKVQFIVTTHSPFVLHSISNAVIYDLENHNYLTDVSDLSVSALVKYHFKISDEYSILIKEKLAHYQALVTKTERTKEENKLLVDLDTELSHLSPVLSPELYLQFTQLQEQLA